ncbi:MAG: M23 family metallopeptidase [bacterium]|nr:M23 family metallopeptidase [bacterium]
MRIKIRFPLISLFLYSLLILLYSCSTTNVETGTEEIIIPKISFDQFANNTGKLFLSGDSESLFDLFSTNMVQHLSLENLKLYMNSVNEESGIKSKIMSSNIYYINELIEFRQLIYFISTEQELYLTLWFNRNREIEGLNLAPVQTVASKEYTDYTTKTPLALPFNGNWYVYWGGRTVEQNYHAAYKYLQYSYDFVISNNGYTYNGDKLNNESYYAFNQPVYAPADGIIIESRSNVADNIPGVMNPEQALGNYLIIDHKNGEYSIMAHFKENSLNIKTGEKVVKGQFLALCGNSGNSSEAHLHYHLQTTAIYRNGIGLPAQFLNYYTNNNFIKSGIPERGQQISREKIN